MMGGAVGDALGYPVEYLFEDKEYNNELQMLIKKAVDLSNLTQEEYGLLMKKKITLEELIEKGKVNVG